MRVEALVQSSNRTAYPTSRPSCTPRSSATRLATVTAPCVRAVAAHTCVQQVIVNT